MNTLGGHTSHDIIEKYLSLKTAQLKPGEDKITTTQLASLYLRVKHNENISAFKLFFLKYFFRKDAWIATAKVHVQEHNMNCCYQKR